MNRSDFIVNRNAVCKHLLNRHWHHLPLNEVLVLPKTDPKRGLALFDVQRRVTRFGPNVLTQRKHKIPWLNFLEQFKNPLIFIYLAASVSTFYSKTL